MLLIKDCFCINIENKNLKILTTNNKIENILPINLFYSIV